MLKKSAKTLVILTALAFIFSSVLLVTASTLVKYECQPSATDNPPGWWVGTNLTVTPTSGSGFNMTCDTPTAVNSNVVWVFTVAQLKLTPYFNISILNDGPVDDSIYMRIFFNKASGGPQISHPDFESDIEDWVRSATKTGLKSVNLLDLLDASGEADDTEYFFQLYIDSAHGPEDTLEVGELYLSNEMPSDDATPAPTQTPGDPTQTPGDPTQTPDDSAQPGDYFGYIFFIAIMTISLSMMVFGKKLKKNSY